MCTSAQPAKNPLSPPPRSLQNAVPDSNLKNGISLKKIFRFMKGICLAVQIRNVQKTPLDFWSWQRHGKCNTMDPELFFHPEGERGGPRRRRIEYAKYICRQCPVIGECRQYALLHREPYGVWGGLSEEERSGILRTENRTRACSSNLPPSGDVEPYRKNRRASGSIGSPAM